MDVKPNSASPVISDPGPMKKSILGIKSPLFSYANQGAACPGNHILRPRKQHGKLEDGFSKGWLDTMRSSSPPQRKHNMDSNGDPAPEETDSAYSFWMLEYPSALGSFEKITKHAQNKRITIFLDYDGTLSPIVNDPDQAFMTDSMRSAVRNVAKCFQTAIVSGRSREKVNNFVGLTEVYYAGSHGMDIMGPVGDTAPTVPSNSIKPTNRQLQGEDFNLFQPAREFLPMIDEFFRTLAENTGHIEGVKVEHNKFCASVHYRNVDETNWPIVAHCVHDVLKRYPRLRLSHGRKVLEIRPVIDWNKGKAVEFLLESFGLSDSDDVLPFYIGDDKTDEDAFKVLRQRNQGCGILVSSVPKETKAFYSLRDPPEVEKFLESLVRWKRKEEAEGR